MEDRKHGLRVVTGDEDDTVDFFLSVGICSW